MTANFLPGVVITGGGASLPGIVEFSKKHLRLPSSLGKPQNVTTIIDRVDDPSFATAVGLVLWGDKYTKGSGSQNFGNVFKDILGGQTMEKAKKLFKSLLP